MLVSLTRLLVDDLSYDTAAHKAADRYDDLVVMTSVLAQRAREVTNKEEADDTERQLDELVRVWSEEAEAHPDMRYQNSNNNYDDSLLVPADFAMTNEFIEYSQRDTPWPTLQSMRDVDAESTLYQIPARKVPR